MAQAPSGSKLPILASPLLRMGSVWANIPRTKSGGRPEQVPKQRTEHRTAAQTNRSRQARQDSSRRPEQRASSGVQEAKQNRPPRGGKRGNWTPPETRARPSAQHRVVPKPPSDPRPREEKTREGRNDHELPHHPEPPSRHRIATRERFQRRRRVHGGPSPRQRTVREPRQRTRAPRLRAWLFRPRSACDGRHRRHERLRLVALRDRRLPHRRPRPRRRLHAPLLRRQCAWTALLLHGCGLHLRPRKCNARHAARNAALAPQPIDQPHPARLRAGCDRGLLDLEHRRRPARSGWHSTRPHFRKSSPGRLQP